MAQGVSNRGIAESLHLSQSSVEKYVTSIFTKLDLGSEPKRDRRILAVLAFLQRNGDDHINAAPD